MRVFHDLECSTHGYMLDVRVDSTSYDEDTKTYPCPVGPDCRAKVSYLAGEAARAQGIIWSNQEESKQLGVRFETQAQKDAYMRAHPNIIEFGKGDSFDKDLSVQAAERADCAAKAWGYRDEHHRREEVQRARAMGHDLSSRARR